MSFAADGKPKFDFDIFMKQLRHRKADPIVRYIRSFIHNFSQRHFTTLEQMKTVQDFKDFIFDKLLEYEPFSLMNDDDLGNAKLGIEKLVMTKIYELCYSPAINPNNLDDSHKLDLEIDAEIYSNYIEYSNITADDLEADDELVSMGDEFIKMSINELNKMKLFKSPRAKIICILNSCKILFQLIKSGKQNQNADEFLPLLIYTIFRGQIEELISNLLYIERFQFVKNSEVEYYLVSLNAAAEYVRNLNRERKNLIDV
ncbi:hypothetical protein WICMUC_003193 [Wickerhamomyces mucosus]|uniref:VPS9 domain-containing protein n=1 Tax=Wickerhamomyces mucosus TaxID=1378264 RepID=A0A9P8PMK2_9ASCO|nr:hypothetical protein WICMUC_003193 [Wickerhamomyces mucosus]